MQFFREVPLGATALEVVLLGGGNGWPFGQRGGDDPMPRYREETIQAEMAMVREMAVKKRAQMLRELLAKDGPILSDAHQQVAETMGLSEQQYVDQVFGGEQRYFRCELEAIATRAPEVGGGAGETAATLALSIATEMGVSVDDMQAQLDRDAGPLDADDRRRMAHEAAQAAGSGLTAQEIDDQHRQDEAERGGR